MAVSASERLHTIAARLRAEGEVGVQREMAAALRLAVRPLIAQVRGAAYVSLPRRGGLNEEQGNQRITTSVLTGARSAGVRLRTRTRGSMQTDQGFVRHPVPSRGAPRADWRWVQQEVPQAEGWWSKTLERESPALTPALVKVMDGISARIQRGF